MRNYEDQSRITDGERAAAEMRGDPMRGNAPRGGDVLSLLADVHARLSKVEDDNADMRSQLSTARDAGDIDFDKAHVNHVLQKYFPHDMPPAATAEPARPKFDAFTGQPLQ